MRLLLHRVRIGGIRVQLVAKLTDRLESNGKRKGRFAENLSEMVKRDWSMAKAWLYEELKATHGDRTRQKGGN